MVLMQFHHESRRNALLSCTINNTVVKFSLDHDKLPSVCKSANVVPIHKSGERTSAENYRPVILTSILMKSLERIIHKHIMKFLTRHSLLIESQHSFKEARSCVT